MIRDHARTGYPIAYAEPQGGFGIISDVHWQAYGLRRILDPAPSVEVPVFRIVNGKAVPAGRTRTLYGLAAFHERPRIVETIIAKPRSAADIEKAIARTTAQIKRINGGMKLCPTHGGWMKHLPDNRILIELLYALSGEEERTKSGQYARRNSLDYHLKEQSRLLGTLKTVRIVRGNSPIASHDGITYIKSGTLDIDPHINPQKIIGYADFSATHLIKTSPILKGMAVIIPAIQWERFCYHLDISADTQAVVPECTVKFDDGTPCLKDVTVYSVFDTIMSRRSTISVQAAERVPLTDEGAKLIEATFRERVREVMDAYADPTGMAVAGLINHEFKEMREDRSCEEEPVDASFFIENAEVLSATHTALMTGLPMNDSEYLNATLPVLLRNRIKHVPLPGLTTPALPDTTLNEHEIIIPAGEAKRLGLSIGDTVTVYRYPNTGIEMAEAAITSFTDLSAILIAPDWWAARFSGDFDGDLIGLMPMQGIVDEMKIHDSVSAKHKGKGVMTIAESIARAFYAKLLIPQADMLATVCVEQGMGLEYIRGILQAAIDGIKHVIEFPDLARVREDLGLPAGLTPTPIPLLLRGKLGSNKKESALRYNALLGRLPDHQPQVPWMRNIQSEFRFILSPNRRYCDLYFGKCGSALQSNYERALSRSGEKELLNIDRNKEGSATLPREITRRTYTGAVNELNRIATKHPLSALVAREIVTTYFTWIEHLKDGSIEEAYRLLRDLRDRLTADDTLGGMALRYLFIALAYGLDPAIRLKSMKILSYLPVVLGEYDLTRYLRKLKYERSFNVRVRPVPLHKQ